MNNWLQCLNKGKKGEERVKTYLERTGWNVEDVSLVEEFQGKDTDFLVSLNSRKTTIEVKTDANINNTGNVCLEEIQSLEKNTPGWIAYCEAEYIWFVCDNIARIAKREDLMEYYNKCRDYKEKTFRNVQFDFGNPPQIVSFDKDFILTSKQVIDHENRTSKIWLISWETFKKYYPVQEVDMEVC